MTTNAQCSPTTINNFEFLEDQGLILALKTLGITSPTPVQQQTLPAAIAGRDILAQAQTGSGKTFAFMLPILKKLRSAPSTRGTVALIVTPTRELALQAKSVVEKLNVSITPACLIGGASAHLQEQQLKRDPRIVIGTPGRLLDFIDSRKVSLRNCQMFALDEADEMLSMGFVDQIREILSMLPKERQGLFFSATISGSVASLAYSFLRDPVVISVEVDQSKKPDTDHFYCMVPGATMGKIDALANILQGNKEEAAIIFCNTKSDTELVEVCLKHRGLDARKINSDLTQRERDNVLTSLRNGKLRYLIATDVAARGIDIKDLPLVVNYSLPKEREVYTHRTGRTGRAGAKGKAVSLVGPTDIGAFYGLSKDSSIGLKELLTVEGSSDLVMS